MTISTILLQTAPLPHAQELEQSIEQVLQHALKHHQSGQLQEAENLYRAILEIVPKHADANHNLGLLALRTRRAGVSLPHFEVALEAQPEQAQYWLNYIDALIQADQIETARQVLELGRHHGLEGDAMENLALQLHASPQFNRPLAEANMSETALSRSPQKNISTAQRRKLEKIANKALARKSPSAKVMASLLALRAQDKTSELESRALLLLEPYPDCGIIWALLGGALQKQGKAALPALQKAAQLLPDDAEVHNSLGAAFRTLGLHDEALASYHQTMMLRPGDAATHSNLGNALQAIGQLHEAVASYRQALAIKPHDATALSNLGAAQHNLGQYDDAISSYQKALSIHPDNATALSNLGMAFKERGQLAEAVACCRRAVALKPDYAGAHNNLGITLKESGQFEDAVASFQRALAIEPNYAEAHSNLLFRLSHSETVDPQALFAESCCFGEQFEAPLQASWLPHGNSREPDRCLQVGFVSGDLRNHAVASFFEPVLSKLSGRKDISLHAYYNHATEDSVTRRLQGYFSHWHSVFGKNDAATAKQIRADGIDILIDLSGHTACNRLPLFARKPAPVQASWMGYPGTTGLQAMDYFLTDRFLLPFGQFDCQFTEKFAYLPVSAPFMPSQYAPAVNLLPALANGHVTFGSFNRLSKLNPNVIALWSQLLRALPDARMLLAGMAENGNNEQLVGWFSQEGISQERLSFQPRSDMQTYLALHHQVDICLDTFPYTGGTTTLHALWMGVPTLTLAGTTAAGRQGAAILGHVGLENFVADDAADFLQKGLLITGNIASLANLRAGLRERFEQSPMGRPEKIADGLAQALRTMWQRWCAGLDATSFEALPEDRNHPTAGIPT